MATSESRSIRGSISGRRWFRRGNPVRLKLFEGRRPAGGDVGSAPPAVAEGDGLLLGVGPEREPVAADADRLAGDALRGVRGEEDDQAGHVLDGAQARVRAIAAMPALAAA